MILRNWSLVVLITLTLTWPFVTRADSAVASDKAAHFGLSAAATTACALFTRIFIRNKWVNAGGCVLAINAAGVAKELTDPYRGGDQDLNDVYANMAGSTFSLFSVSFGF